MDNPKKREKKFTNDFENLFGDDFMQGFDEEFKRMREYMSHILGDALNKQGQEDAKKYVYGFSMHTDPAGKPVFEEFGNIPRDGVNHVPGEREPLVDVISKDDEVTVIAELPGVEKDDIDLEAGEKSLSIKVDTEKRKYYKEIELPDEVDENSIKANYKNGILEVKLKRKTLKKSKSKRITIG